jgi:potassium-transporting ATPase KdpC subunit
MNVLNVLNAPVRISILFLLLFGGLYPLAVTGAGQALFPGKAQGSLVTNAAGQTVGSKLIAQAFDKDIYFHPRPSAAGADGYDATASSGSNLAPSNKALIDRVTADAAALRAENPSLNKLPADLLTTSASGLDPDLTPDAVMAQVPRVAKARGLSEAQVTEVVNSQIIGRDLGIFGEKRVNVLELNLALDALKP